MLAGDENSVESDFENVGKKRSHLELLVNSVDYAIVLDYMLKFSQYLLDKEFCIQTFESILIDYSDSSINRRLRSIHFKLIKRLNSGKYVKKHKWEMHLAKFARNYSNEDYNQIIENGYLSLSIEQKLRIIKCLMEAQFDENVKFRQLFTDETKDFDYLRTKSIGRDKNGYVYWFFMDPFYSFRLFSESYNGNEWKLISNDENSLKIFIDKLENSNDNGEVCRNKGSITTKKRLLRTTSIRQTNSTDVCQKCSNIQKKNNLLKCRVCSEASHSFCIPYVEYLNEDSWKCSNCEHVELIKNLKNKFEEITSNSWKISFADDKSDFSSDDEKGKQQHYSSQVGSLDEVIVEKPVQGMQIHGKIRLCRLNKVNYRIFNGEDEENEDNQNEEAYNVITNEGSEYDFEDDCVKITSGNKRKSIRDLKKTRCQKRKVDLLLKSSDISEESTENSKISANSDDLIISLPSAKNAMNLRIQKNPSKKKKNNGFSKHENNDDDDDFTYTSYNEDDDYTGQENLII